MTQLSPTQQRIIDDAIKNPATCITECMGHIKNPMIRQKSLDSMLAKGLLNKRFTDMGKETYLLSDAGLAAASNAPQREATPSNTPQQNATPGDEPKRETKQSIIIELLSRENGTTLAELIKATEWKPHSIRGHLSNLRKKRGLPIEAFTTSEGVRGYRLIEAQAS